MVIVYTHVLWLASNFGFFFFFPSHFGTTYLSPSVNPRLLLSREGHRGLGALFEQHVSKLPLAPGDWARLLKGSTAQNKPDLERFHSPGAEHWGGQCHLPIAQGQHSFSGSSTGTLSPLSWLLGSVVCIKPTLSAFFKCKELAGK